jgi:aminoglycoside phosphotransferase (APT) family kinase protein
LVVERLAAFIATASGGRDVRVDRCARLSGGAIQENLALDVRIDGCEHALVLRKDAPARLAVSRTRTEEFALLQAAFAAGVRVPEPLWASEDPAIVGTPFFIMRRAAGTAVGRRVVRDHTLGGERATLAARLAEQLARIHAIRPPRTDLAFLGPQQSVHDFVTEAYAFLDAGGRIEPALELGLRWLDVNAPAPAGAVLVHRDFRTGNYLLDADGITAILDWEFAGWGDPDEDIGWFCAWCWRFGADDREAGGIGSRADFYAAYERASGRRVDDARVRYWETYAHARWAVIARRQAQRHLDGAERSLELLLIGTLAPELDDMLLRGIA